MNSFLETIEKQNLDKLFISEVFEECLRFSNSGAYHIEYRNC